MCFIVIYICPSVLQSHVCIRFCSWTAFGAILWNFHRTLCTSRIYILNPCVHLHVLFYYVFIQIIWNCVLLEVFKSATKVTCVHYTLEDFYSVFSRADPGFDVRGGARPFLPKKKKKSKKRILGGGRTPGPHPLNPRLLSYSSVPIHIQILILYPLLLLNPWLELK